MSVNPNHQEQKLSAKQRLQSGAGGLGLSTVAMVPEIATGLAGTALFCKGKDIFVKSDKKILSTVKKVLCRNPWLAGLTLAGIGVSGFLEYHSQKMMGRAFSGKKAEKPKAEQ